MRGASGARGAGPSVVGVLAALAAAACVRVPPPDLAEDPRLLLDQVRSAQRQVRSCRGGASVSISSPGGSGSFGAWLAAERPDRVRVEILDFFGNTAAVLVAGGGRFSLYDARAGVLHRGDDSPENVSRLLPVPVDARTLSALVCGSVPLVEGEAVEARPGSGVMVLTIAAPPARQVLDVGPEASIRSARTEPGRGSGPAWTATFEEFRRRGGVLVPLEAELEGGGASVSMRWSDDLEVNEMAGEDAFRLDPPRGARVVDLPPGSAPPAVDLPMAPARPAPGGSAVPGARESGRPEARSP